MGALTGGSKGFRDSLGRVVTVGRFDAPGGHFEIPPHDGTFPPPRDGVAGHVAGDGNTVGAQQNASHSAGSGHTAPSGPTRGGASSVRSGNEVGTNSGGASAVEDTHAQSVLQAGTTGAAVEPARAEHNVENASESAHVEPERTTREPDGESVESEYFDARSSLESEYFDARSSLSEESSAEEPWRKDRVRDPGSNLPYTPRYLNYPANTPYTAPDAPAAGIWPPVPPEPDPSDPCPPESDPDSDSRGAVPKADRQRPQTASVATKDGR